MKILTQYITIIASIKAWGVEITKHRRNFWESIMLTRNCSSSCTFNIISLDYVLKLRQRTCCARVAYDYEGKGWNLPKLRRKSFSRFSVARLTNQCESYRSHKENRERKSSRKHTSWANEQTSSEKFSVVAEDNTEKITSLVALLEK